MLTVIASARAARLTIAAPARRPTALTAVSLVRAAKSAKTKFASARAINPTKAAVNALSVQQTRIAQTARPAKAVFALVPAARVSLTVFVKSPTALTAALPAPQDKPAIQARKYVKPSKPVGLRQRLKGIN